MNAFSYAALASLALFAGVALPVQAGLNNGLRRLLGEPVRASLASFVVGTVVLAVATLATREAWPAPVVIAKTPWWAWGGGVLGAFYIFSVIVLVPRLGAGLTFALVVAGQMLCSLAIDHFGLFGLPRTPVNPVRIGGAALLVAGVLLIRR